jgi:hypothetical protein
VRVYETSTVLAVLMKVYPLQGSVDLPRGERGLYNKTCLTPSDSAYEDINIKVEDTEVKVEKIPLPLLYQRIKVEPDEVSYMSLYPLFDHSMVLLLSSSSCCNCNLCVSAYSHKTIPL